MIRTPISDYLDKYEKSGAARFHMPGHKGRGDGGEIYDITEIDGAGELFSTEGIIADSEEIASSVFGFRTYYSAEGSSLAIRAMTSLAARRAGSTRVIAGRNAHRSFLSSAILLGLDVKWIYPPRGESYLSCPVTPDDVAKALDEEADASFVYITSPDYLGNICDIEEIARVCRERGTMLLVDCAHGAYFKFLRTSQHPIDLGADMCAASAHKTLPVLTGGAYLQLSDSADALFSPREVKETMELFASSSPSYLILRSLDRANAYIDENRSVLADFERKAAAVKRSLEAAGYTLCGDEAWKITISALPFGYTGDELANEVIRRGIAPEFHDSGFLSFMLTPENTDSDLERLRTALLGIEKRPALVKRAEMTAPPKIALTPRDAFFAEREVIPTAMSVGRIFASAAVSCPPAVPIAFCGEVITDGTARRLSEHGITEVQVVKKNL